MISSTPVAILGKRNLQEVKETLEAHWNMDKQVLRNGWPEDELLHRRWNQLRPYNFDIIEREVGTGEQTKFIFVEGYTERTKYKKFWYIRDISGEGELEEDIEDLEDDEEDQNNGAESELVLVPKEDRVNETRAMTVFFEHNNAVFCTMFLSPNAKFNRICSDLFPEDTWGNISKCPPDFQMPDDLFYWLLNNFISNTKRLGNHPLIYLSEWLGFSGTTQDNTHKLTGEGEQIAAILGTLAFLFMNDPLKALRLHIQYDEEKITCHYGLKGNCRIEEGDYDGVYANRYFDSERNILLSILMFTKIIPGIKIYYTAAVGQGNWNPTLRRQFTEGIGTTIIQRIQEVIQ